MPSQARTPSRRGGRSGYTIRSTRTTSSTTTNTTTHNVTTTLTRPYRGPQQRRTAARRGGGRRERHTDEISITTISLYLPLPPPAEPQVGLQPEPEGNPSRDLAEAFHDSLCLFDTHLAIAPGALGWANRESIGQRITKSLAHLETVMSKQKALSDGTDPYPSISGVLEDALVRGYDCLDGILEGIETAVEITLSHIYDLEEYIFFTGEVLAEEACIALSIKAAASTREVDVHQLDEVNEVVELIDEWLETVRKQSELAQELDRSCDARRESLRAGE